MKSFFPSFIMLFLFSILLGFVLHVNSKSLTMKLIPRADLNLRNLQFQNQKSQIMANVEPDEFARLFLVNVSLGQPPFYELLVMDTGSSLTWLSCEPCEKCEDEDSPFFGKPFFDQSHSSTFQEVGCSSATCATIELYQPKCDLDMLCQYDIRYAGKSKAQGLIALESVRFPILEGGFATVNDVVFGCTHQSNAKIIRGVLGLGLDEVSLVRRFGLRFSYCTGELDDLFYSYNSLTFGDGAVLWGDSTPLEIFNGAYYVKMEGIKVDGESLDIDPVLFERNAHGTTGVIFDSGTANIFLIDIAYYTLITKIMGILEDSFVRFNKFHINSICYYGDFKTELEWFPVITLVFDGLELDLETPQVFEQYRGYFCISISRSGDPGVDLGRLNIIGMRAQQLHNVGFDLENKRLYMERVDCEDI